MPPKHDNTLKNCIDMRMLEGYGHTHTLLNTIFDSLLKGVIWFICHLMDIQGYILSI
jgi:hypothetical protein